MPRVARIGLVAVLLLLVGMGTWWLTRSNAPYPSSQPIASLQDSTTIRWGDDGLAVIDARDSLGALTGLGYVHGLTRAWTVALWRQTARGRLSRWFGSGVLPIDRHVRRLGLAHNARIAYEQLPSADRERLQAYAKGLNATLQSELARQQDAFVLHEVTPAPWKPWHTLAVERLLAWLATDPLDPPSHAPAAVDRFRQNDQLLRRWLHLHGWARSVAWAVRAPDGAGSRPTALFQRHVIGATASPVFQEVQVERPGGPALTGATFPGVPLMPTGSQGNRAWASLLRSPARLAQVPDDSTDKRQRFERLTPAGGDEQLLRIRRLDGGAFLGRTAALPTADSTARPDSTAWVLRWPGLSAASDLPAWLQRAGLAQGGDPAAFHLFEADGLEVHDRGTWTVLGAPDVVVRDSARSVLVGQTSWAQHQAQSLRAHSRAAAALDVPRWSTSDSSTWAAGLLPRLQPALTRLSVTHPEFQDVVTYLRNWNETYNPSSIGASLFDRWMRAYRADLGHVPRPSDTTAYFSTYRQHRALLQALDTLRAQFGPDIRRWRWERVVHDRRFFPVWSADSLVADDLEELATTQYAPLDRSGRGHPSALAGGPSLVAPSRTAPSPTTWEGWTTVPGRRLTVRRHHYDPTATFARSGITRSRPPPVRLAPDSTTHTTLLVPSPE